jgi:hypothetical protein
LHQHDKGTELADIVKVNDSALQRATLLTANLPKAISFSSKNSASILHMECMLMGPFICFLPSWHEKVLIKKALPKLTRDVIDAHFCVSFCATSACACAMASTKRM